MERIKNFPKSPSEVRLWHKKLRQEMSPSEVAVASDIICEKLVKAEWYASCTWIYGYYPLGNEVNCLAFLGQALRDCKRVALPRMAQKTYDDVCSMDFYEITSLEQVKEGSFGVLEPDANCPIVQQNEAVVLVPGVAFDVGGNRYGYGKGYYDRYFARFPQLYKLALAYEHQIEEVLTVFKSDVRMDSIYTECRCIGL